MNISSYKTNTVLSDRNLDDTYNSNFQDNTPFYLIKIDNNKYCIRKGLRKTIITILEKKIKKDCIEYHITSNYHRKGYSHIVYFYNNETLEYRLIKFINEAYKEAIKWKLWTFDDCDVI